MKHHPIVDLFPAMSDDEFQALKSSIEARGLRDPCRTWQGRLVDGRHRLRACEELGITPTFVECEGDEEEMVRSVFDINLSRRHLTSSQKAAVAVEFEELLARLGKKAKERQHAQAERGKEGGRGKKKETLPEKVPGGFDGDTRDQVAKMVGTNGKYVSDAKKVKRKAPDLHAKVKAGTLSVKGAVAALNRQQKEEQRKAREQEAVVAAYESDRWKVERADCLRWLRSQPADSIDLVFGSPPYEDVRLYLENGEDQGIARNTEQWVAWMVEVYQVALKCCKGLVAFVVAGCTKKYRWSAAPVLLMADLHRAGIHLRNPPLYRRVGIPGSGGPDWLRSDYEFIVCATRGAVLPWSDNTAMGHAPKFAPGGKPTHRTQDGSRVNSEAGYATMEERDNIGPHRARQQAGRDYQPPEVANPGNVIDCVAGGGNMGDDLCHQNEAPFPERLAEFFVRSFCPPSGLVCDPFSGSGTTGKMALTYGRRFLGCDIRESQVDLSRRRLAQVQQVLPFEVGS